MGSTIIQSQDPLLTYSDCPSEPCIIPGPFELPNVPPWDEVRYLPDFSGQPSTEEKPFIFDVWCAKVAPDLFDPCYAASKDAQMFDNPDGQFTQLNPKEKAFATAMENFLRLIRADITRFRNDFRRIYATVPKVQQLVFGQRRKKGPLDGAIPALMLTIQRLMVDNATSIAVNKFRQIKAWPSKREEDNVRKILNCSYALMGRFTTLWGEMNKVGELILRAKGYKAQATSNLSSMKKVMEKRHLVIDYLQIMYEKEWKNVSDRLQECDSIIFNTVQRFKYEFSTLATQFASSCVIPHVRVFNTLFSAYWKTAQRPKGIDRLRGMTLADTLNLTQENMREVHRRLAAKFRFIRPNPNEIVDDDEDDAGGTGGGSGGCPDGRSDTTATNIKNEINRLKRVNRNKVDETNKRNGSTGPGILIEPTPTNPFRPIQSAGLSRKNKRKFDGDQDPNAYKKMSLGDFVFSGIKVPRA
ncbi:hypothetical protein AA313_de0209651 [Arthrobotrys entomopaga]|nr:hypothetical protein AA313_de0209651 [Arthrobotrys entomopaga]